MALPSRAVVDSRNARALRHWSREALGRACVAVERVFGEACGRWQLDGVVSCADNAIDVAPAIGPLDWLRIPGLAAWIGSSDGSAAHSLETLLFGANAGGGQAPIGRHVAEQAITDLLQRLSQLCVGSPKSEASLNEVPPATDAKRWSGAVVLELDFSQQDRSRRWRLHCGPMVASVLCGGEPLAANAAGRAPVVAVTQAIASRSVPLKVCLDHTPLTLGTLQSLRVGDVLPLSHRLDAPLRVTAADTSGEPHLVCSAYLGRRGSSRAVELVAVDPVSQ